LFEIVENQESVTVSEDGNETRTERLVADFRDTKDMRKRCRHEVSVDNGRQRNEVDAIRKKEIKFLCDPYCKASFADPAWTDKRQQTDIIASQQGADLIDLEIAADKAR
jgi:hypothetical protein